MEEPGIRIRFGLYKSNNSEDGIDFFLSRELWGTSDCDINHDIENIQDKLRKLNRIGI